LAPESPRATKRIFPDNSEMHIGALVAEAPAGMESEYLSPLAWM